MNQKDLQDLLDAARGRAGSEININKRSNPRSEPEPPAFSDYIEAHPELQIKECSCEREFSFAKLHCPNCGRAPLYPMKAIKQMLPSGLEVMATKFRCRGCPRIYTDVDVYYNCKAKPPREKASVLKARDEVMRFTGGLTSNELIQRVRQKRIDEGKPLGSLENTGEKEPKPGTPEWYEAHPEES